MLGVDVRIVRSKLMTPVAVAALPRVAPLHESLKSLASSWAAVAAAARRKLAFREFTRWQ